MTRSRRLPLGSRCSGDAAVTRLRPTRRQFVKASAAGACECVFPLPLLAQGRQPRIVVIGGGFAGATAARFLKCTDPRLDVTLVEPNPVFAACPFSNEVIASLRDMRAQLFGYDRVATAGVVVVHQAATAIDGQARTVTLGNGGKLAYDRLVLAPGSDLRFDALPGYDAAAAERMPHAWKAGEQTLLLRRQLDAKDTFSMQRLFENAWQELYPNLEWVPVSSGGNPTGVDAAAMTVSSDFDTYKAAVANVIPPQKAGRIAELAGTADRTGWCPVDPKTFESHLVPGIHVLGDAAIAGAVPKSAFAGNAAAKICAAAVAKLVRGETPAEPKFVNTCYSKAAPDYGFSVAGVYQPMNGQWLEIEGAGGISPVDAPRAFRSQEAKFGNGWFNTITSEIFG